MECLNQMGKTRKEKMAIYNGIGYMKMESWAITVSIKEVFQAMPIHKKLKNIYIQIPDE